VALGNAHRDRWEWAESDRAYRRALELAPDDPEASQQYAEMLAGMGRTEEAIPYARRAAELDPLAAVRLNALGYILWNADRPDEALASLRRAFAIDSTLSYVNGNIGRILISTGRYAEAEAFMQEIGVPVDAPTRRVTRALAAADTAAAIEILRADTLVPRYYYRTRWSAIRRARSPHSRRGCSAAPSARPTRCGVRHTFATGTTRASGSSCGAGISRRADAARA
jgi:Flp pilus assembly protein TadD